MIYIAQQDYISEGYSVPKFVCTTRHEIDAYIRGCKDSCGMGLYVSVYNQEDSSITKYEARND